MAGRLCRESRRQLQLVYLLIVLRTVCMAQEVRLIGGSGSYEGRVEIFKSNQWGTICDDLWDINDVTVVCRMLDNRTAVTNATYGAGVGPIWWSNFRCEGSEMTLAYCHHTTPDVDVCTHEEDAGVQCSPKENDVRLKGGNSANEGRVEIYIMKTWSAVCSNSKWDRQEADVACRQVGYPGGSIESRGDFGTSSAPPWHGEVTCDGTEQTLSACMGTISPRATTCQDEQAAVVCSTEMPASDDLSTGAIAGIAVGFGLVILMCCLFSLNCKCRPFWKKRDADNTGVYECNTTSNADNRVYSTASQGKNETLSESQPQSNLDNSNIDPNLFIFAPKVPVPFMIDKPHLPVNTNENPGEAKPNGVLAGERTNDASPLSDENHVTLSMTTDTVTEPIVSYSKPIVDDRGEEQTEVENMEEKKDGKEKEDEEEKEDENFTDENTEEDSVGIRDVQTPVDVEMNDNSSEGNGLKDGSPDLSPWLPYDDIQGDDESFDTKL